VVCGHDRDFVALLLFPSVGAAPGEARGAKLQQALAAWNREHPASSTRVARAAVLPEPPSIDAGEITDKGYINQRAVIERRSAWVTRLFAAQPDAGVMVLAP
jgi:feruloyl-CoA synthase